MIEKIIKLFFVKEKVEKKYRKITVIKEREVSDFREMIKKEIYLNENNPENEKTCLSGYFENIKSLYGFRVENSTYLRSLR